jgi:hypothetical protein
MPRMQRRGTHEDGGDGDAGARGGGARSAAAGHDGHVAAAKRVGGARAERRRAGGDARGACAAAAAGGGGAAQRNSARSHQSGHRAGKSVRLLGAPRPRALPTRVRRPFRKRRASRSRLPSGVPSRCVPASHSRARTCRRVRAHARHRRRREQAGEPCSDEHGRVAAAAAERTLRGRVVRTHGAWREAPHRHIGRRRRNAEPWVAFSTACCARRRTRSAQARRCSVAPRLYATARRRVQHGAYLARRASAPSGKQP